MKHKSKNEVKGTTNKELTCVKNNTAGITLIALVITIVTLLILAGISINLIFSNDGIIKKAQEAANAQKEAMEKDQQAINDLGEQLNSLVNEETSEDTGDSDNTGGQEETQIISFTIEGTAYSALSGMKWEDWVNSSYNTDNFVLFALGGNKNTIRNSSGHNVLAADNATTVMSTDLISEQAYKLGSDSPYPGKS